jgi:2-polyprenyl-3-methyl-5-hydroxy-6-metoxy-1,4-benzoquinol methylase
LIHSETLSLVRCPRCSGDLQQNDSDVRCAACGATYPIRGHVLTLLAPTLDAHQQKQEAFFTAEADGYERDVVQSPFYQALDDLTVGRWAAALPPDSLVLDIGSGTGRVAIALAKQGHRVIAIDLTEALLQRAYQKAVEAGVADRIDFVRADMESLPLTPGRVDAAVAHGVLHHLAQPQILIARAGMALRPGGYWFSLDPHRSPARALFDAAMRWRTLWQEEAAPDGLQTEARLRAWCEEADIEPRVGYSCYVLPHLLLSLPRAAIRPMLSATDAMLRRSVLRRLAGVIFVAGRRRPIPPVVAPRFATGVLLALLAGVTLATGVWRADPDVAARSAAYYMDGLGPMLARAEAASRFGATLVTADGGPLEQATLDDVGYMLGLQLVSLAGVSLNPQLLAHVHAAAYAVAIVLFAGALGVHYRSHVAAAAAAIALALLGSRLSMLIYGQVSNQTATSLFPPLALAAFIVWSHSLAPNTPRRLVWSSIGLGLFIGLVDLVRHSHGLALVLTLAVVLACGLRGRRLRVATALLAGYLAVTIAVPAALKVHRDIALQRWSGWSTAYLRRPPAHHIAYTLLTAVGRYPNSLGLYYEDRSVDRYITARVPDARNVPARVEAARELWVEYARRYPGEYAAALVGGATELLPFVAYTTFVAPRRWEFAWPSVVPGIAVEPRDLARYGTDLLMNVRVRYLRLDAWQGVVLVLAVAALATAVVRQGILAWRTPATIATPVAVALLYLAFVALPRALIPVQGMDFVFAFWCVSILCAAHVMLEGPPSPLIARYRRPVAR